MKILARLLCVALLAGCAEKAPEGAFEQNATGVIVTPASGDAKRVRIEVRSNRIMRVTAVANEDLELPASLMVVPGAAAAPTFMVERKDDDLAISTAVLVAHVSLANGVVRFTDIDGKALLEEAPARVLANGVSQRFNPGSDEAFYGLGQHQNGQLNLNGEDVEIAQHNMDIGVPFVVSSRES